MRIVATVIVVASLALAAGCQTYALNQVALVPRSTGMLTDGQPLTRAAEVGFGASSAVDPVAPTSGAANVGDYVPQTQFRADLAFRLGKYVSLWFAGEDGNAGNARPVAALPLDNNTADVYGAGTGLSVFIPTSNPNFKIALSSELIIWNVPWVQYSTCTENCTGYALTYAEQGTTMVPTLAVDVTPSYRIGPFAVFAGVTLRNQITVPAAEITAVPDGADVSTGPYNVTLHAGVDYEVADAFKLLLSLQQTITSDPINYGPDVAVMVRVPFGGPPAAR